MTAPGTTLLPILCWPSIRKTRRLSARLATAFRTWRTLEKSRRAKAEAALNRIRAVSTLSRDLADIVERALATP